jgi:hypothetical protein
MTNDETLTRCDGATARRSDHGMFKTRIPNGTPEISQRGWSFEHWGIFSSFGFSHSSFASPELSEVPWKPRLPMTWLGAAREAGQHDRDGVQFRSLGTVWV